MPDTEQKVDSQSTSMTDLIFKDIDLEQHTLELNMHGDNKLIFIQFLLFMVEIMDKL